MGLLGCLVGLGGGGVGNTHDALRRAELLRRKETARVEVDRATRELRDDAGGDDDRSFSQLLWW
eukprot:scaffold70511_cov51-Phaeocystis_antarctica.AAC.1